MEVRKKEEIHEAKPSGLGFFITELEEDEKA
jgi:hypothetical protein